MSKYIKFMLTTLLLSLILFEAVVFGILIQKKGVFEPSYQSMIVDKYRILENTDEKKIIMIAGSSSAFGLDQELLEEQTGYKVANLGLHAGFGYLFTSELAKENINEGDIVLLGYEYDWINNFDYWGQSLIMSGIDDNIDMYKLIPPGDWKEFVGYMFSYAAKKHSYGGSSGNYSRSAFSSENGQMTWPRYYAMSDYFERESTYGHISVLDNNGNVSITDRSIEYLRDLKKYVEERGASIYFVSSPILYESVSCSVDDFLKLAELEEELVGIPYISDPRLYMFPIDLMADAVNHCNSEGQRVRTSILAEDLRLCGAIKSESLTEITKSEHGETLVLVDLLPKRLLHKPEEVRSVYSMDSAGNVTEYKEGTDYLVDYERGTIRRTDSSAIPNYSEHHVTYDSGKFSLVRDSENQNPESNRSYHICVDYEYLVSEKELEAVTDSSSYLSDDVKSKVLNGESITIALCGDSIGAGADTNGQDIFLYYLAGSLEQYYGVDVNTAQLSAEEGSRDYLLENIPQIIELHPDVVMIEFGMEDHCDTDAAAEKNINCFTSDIETAVDTLWEHGIDAILIGFPQQNMTWNAEDVEATKLYNEALKAIADSKNVYFADVYDIFDQVGKIKPISRDVMADFIHHPTEWGHKLYYTSIIEAFNFNGDMKPINLPYYICVD